MAETGGYVPPEAKKLSSVALAVKDAETQSGLTLEDISRLFRLDTDDTSLLLEAAKRIPREDAIASASGAVHEIRTNDEYRLPSLNELLNGGGKYWRPLFSTERAGEISPDDDLQGMAEKGLPHILTERTAITEMLGRLQSGEQTNFKALSARILEMTVLRNMIDGARLTASQGDGQPLEALMKRIGMSSEAFLDQAEAFELLMKDSAGGIDLSEKTRILASSKTPAERVVAGLDAITENLGGRLKPYQDSIQKAGTFLPNLSFAYAGAFGRYSNAKLASTSATPPATK